MKSVGIDIGSYSIKIVEVDTMSKGYAITRFHEHVLSTSPAQDQDIEILDFLRGFAKQYDPDQTTFVVGVRQEKISVRNKLFPFRERQKILKSLAFELEDDVPFAGDSAIFDAKVIRHTGSQAEILACACPKVHITQARNQVAEAGMPPNIVTGEGLALSNLYEAWDSPPPGKPAEPALTEGDSEQPTQPTKDVMALLYMGHTRTIICFFEGRTLIGVRSLLWGGKVIGDAISRKYDLPIESALRELQNKGFILTSKEGATYDQIAFSDVISNCVKDLVKEAQLTFLEAQSELTCRVRSISLLGGTSRLQNLGAYLTQQFEIPVNRTSAFRQFNSPRFQVNESMEATAGVALSLAVEGLKRPRNPAVNFLKGDLAEQSQMAKRILERWSKVAMLAAAFVVFFMAYGMVRESFSKTAADEAHALMREQAMEVAGLPRTQVTIPGVSKWISSQERKVQELERLEGLADMNSALEVLNLINNTLPARQNLALEVKNFAVNDNMVRMEGWVKGSPQQLQKALAGLAQGGKVETSPSKIQAPGGAQSFAFRFQVDRNLNLRGL